MPAAVADASELADTVAVVQAGPGSTDSRMQQSAIDAVERKTGCHVPAVSAPSVLAKRKSPAVVDSHWMPAVEVFAQTVAAVAAAAASMDCSRLESIEGLAAAAAMDSVAERSVTVRCVRMGLMFGLRNQSLKDIVDWQKLVSADMIAPAAFVVSHHNKTDSTC